MAVAHELKDNLRNADERPSGGVTYSSDAFGVDDIDESVASQGYTPTSGTVKVPLSPQDKEDPLLKRAVGSAGDTLHAKVQANTGGGIRIPGADFSGGFSEGEVELTEDERESFLDAVVSGERYVYLFSLFGGRIRGKLRCRSTHESEAIAAWMDSGVREARYKSPLDYAIDLRNALLAAQVEEINGTRFLPLADPLLRTADPKDAGKTIDPGWLAQAAGWALKPEPLISAVYNELLVFERKYWTMVRHAGDSNFWRPAGST